MRKEFNELVSTLKRWDLYFRGDEVYIALTDLENKIAEETTCINLQFVFAF